MPPRLSNWSFPASQVPPWRLAGCPISPFLFPWCLPGCPNDPCLPPCHIPAGRCRAELWPPSTSLPVQMVFQWRLAVSRASKIKSGLGRLLESVGLALADYWNHLVLPWQITGVIQSPSWRRRAKSFSKGSRSTDSSSQTRPSWLGHPRGRNPISDGRQILSKF